MTRLPDDAWADEQKQARLYEIERTLKFDPHHPYRRQMVAEYVRLTEPTTEKVAA